VKAPFALAQRPISAAPGRTNRIAVRETPGPQDYNPVDVNSYKQRRNVIPKFVFTTSHKGIESLAKSEARAKSPGPNHYRPQSAAVLSKMPICTIGNTLREIHKDRHERL